MIAYNVPSAEDTILELVVSWKHLWTVSLSQSANYVKRNINAKVNWESTSLCAWRRDWRWKTGKGAGVENRRKGVGGGEKLINNHKEQKAGKIQKT